MIKPSLSDFSDFVEKQKPVIIKSKIDIQKDQTMFIKKLMENRLLTIRAAENVVRILPPLNVKKNEIFQALKIINKVCSELK